MEGFEGDDRRLVRQSEARVSAVDRAPRVRATKLNWDVTEQVEHFGEGKPNFQATYDDAPVPASA